MSMGCGEIEDFKEAGLFLLVTYYASLTRGDEMQKSKHIVKGRYCLPC